MSEIEINTRIQQRHGTEYNWLQKSTFIPRAGEIIIYDAETSSDTLPQGRTQRYDYPRLKIGDGTTAVMNLPFVGDGIFAESTNTSINYTNDLVNDRLSPINDAISAINSKITVQSYYSNSDSDETNLNAWLDARLEEMQNNSFMVIRVSCIAIDGVTFYGILYKHYDGSYATLTLHSYTMSEVKKIKNAGAWANAVWVDNACFTFNNGTLSITT